MLCELCLTCKTYFYVLPQEGGDEHGGGYAGGVDGDGDDVDADDEDDDMCDEGATGEYVAGQSGAEPSLTAAAPRHGDGRDGGEASQPAACKACDEDDGVDADDEDDGAGDTGADGAHAAGQGGAEPSPATGVLRPGDGSDGVEASQPAACEACDEGPRTAGATASGHAPAAGDPGDGETAAKPAERGATDVSTSRTDTSHVNTHMNDVTDAGQPDVTEVEPPKSKRQRVRVRGGRPQNERQLDDTRARRLGA